MPKKKIIHHDEPVSVRPHRNMKAKVVFDPSDNHIPKKRAKYSFKNEKLTEASTVKKTTNVRTRVKKRKRVTTKSKILPVTESLDDLPTENNTKSPIVSPTNSPVKKIVLAEDPPASCFICLTISGKSELIDCAICSIRAHRHCLIVNEPMWKFKLDLGPWLCKECRKQNCSKCLKDDSRSKIQRRCITCEVGLHSICYESCDIKPLHKLETDMYVCIPCMTLATQINPEEEEEVVETVEPVEVVKAAEPVEPVNDIIKDDVKSHTSSVVSISSDEYDTDSKSNRSYSCSSDYEKYDAYQNNNIPNITKWNKDQVFKYLADLLPQEIIDQIIKYDLDGRAIQLLQRNDIVFNMGLKLGHAMKFYKQVRILQSQSTFSRIFWE
ncbi:uncharacterized protein LOC100166730 [Acyrthosiphon pisum]|uniref:Zinc finger PHD-type domain-containing protein n=1 Tax=Acyrthosiphon pisum TaxID=7029 RepID=A0A8R2JRQ5_ACYPI|nr:uncharacterized protein LOC100166730 [Acyrthosiphon pisum]|eukprot:XP_008181516.1 PREDICTED: uncharacterized protein LOC100166730 isoform X1 [Acyrthosiphon pisum]